MSASESSSPEESYIQNLTESSEDDISSSSSDECTVPIRTRQRFKPNETIILEQQYQTCSKPSTETKQRLSERLDTSLDRIQVWFQNRRAKEKKSIKPKVEQINDGDDENEEQKSKTNIIYEDVPSSQADGKQSSSEENSRASSQNTFSQQCLQHHPQPQHAYFHPHGNTFLGEGSQSIPEYESEMRPGKRFKPNQDCKSPLLTQIRLLETQ